MQKYLTYNQHARHFNLKSLTATFRQKITASVFSIIISTMLIGQAKADQEYDSKDSKNLKVAYTCIASGAGRLGFAPKSNWAATQFADQGRYSIATFDYGDGFRRYKLLLNGQSISNVYAGTEDSRTQVQIDNKKRVNNGQGGMIDNIIVFKKMKTLFGAIEEFAFNMETLKFVNYSTGGYLNAPVSYDGAPYIEIGNCTSI